jgi:hypothetical protein
MAKDMPVVTKATKKTVVLTLEMDADSMAELYSRLGNILASVENAADVKNVEVKDGKPSNGINYRASTF